MTTAAANFVETPFGPSLAPAQRAARAGRNHFKELFEQTATGETPARPATPQAALAHQRVTFSPPALTVRSELHSGQPGQPPAEHTRSAAAGGAAGPPANSPAPGSLSAPGIDLSGYKPMASPVSLQPLTDALTQAGLSPDKFQFDQIESFEAFPTRPDLSYTNRQILIRGPRGAGLFDWTWALRTPWVTAIELKTLGIA